MSTVSRSVLFSKLNINLFQSLESAFTYAKFRENSHVELMHWLYMLFQQDDTDIFYISNFFTLDKERLKNDMLQNIENLPNGATHVIDFSPHIEHCVEQAWKHCTLAFNAEKIRGFHLIYALWKSSELLNIVLRTSTEFSKIKADILFDQAADIVKNSIESSNVNKVSDNTATEKHSQTALAKFGVNLTDLARQGELDPVVGREQELQQIIDILMRRRQNNPVLAGEAGVGKTAIIESLALKIYSRDVPASLKDVNLVSLDLGALKAGASISGEFEARLKSVISEVESSDQPIILFIDEIHTIVGSVGSEGTADAANLLKPALARGKLRTIGATTWSEYKKYFEKDPALTRRFQLIQVEEPSENEAVEMLRGLSPALEAHHDVLILDEALSASVQLSHRYIADRQLPDKAISLIDTACARVALSQSATPSIIRSEKRKITSLEFEKANLEREAKLEYQQEARIAKISEELERLRDELNIHEERWQTEFELVNDLIKIRKLIMSFDHSTNQQFSCQSDTLRTKEQDVNSKLLTCNDVTMQDTASMTENQIDFEDMSYDQLLKKQNNIIAKLRSLQEANVLVMPLVDAHTVAQVVSDWTGIPAGKMVKNELQAILDLTQTLSKRVIAQEHGIEEIVKRIQTSRANLDDPNKPIGVFMLAGPSGVGKTETALALADALYGGEHNVITINMSEYQEPHTVSTLKGAPPGYVGYGEGGVLTEAVRRKPYSVILLDEVEKAHSDVHEIFFQVFDKGWMEDGEGRYIDFKNTIIILTTNVGSELIMDMCEDGHKQVDLNDLQDALRAPMLSVFPAALLGRIQTIPYFPLSPDTIVKIIRLQLDRVVKRVKDNHDIKLNYNDDVLTYIASKCHQVESGGRMIDSILTNTILPEISQKVLSSIINGERLETVVLSVDNKRLTYDYK